MWGAHFSPQAVGGLEFPENDIEEFIKQIRAKGHGYLNDVFFVSSILPSPKANEQIDTLKADIQKYTADAAKLTKEIAELDEDITIWEGDIIAATNVREIEKGDYDAMHKDYSESVDALCLVNFDDNYITSKLLW